MKPPSEVPRPVPDQRQRGEAYWRRAWEDYVSTLQRDFPALLSRVLKAVKRETPPGEVVLWHLYNAGWLLRARHLLLGMDLALLDDLGVSREERLALFGALDALFITHQHADHCCARDIAVLAELGEPPIFCHPDTARVLYRNEVPEKQVVELEAGEATVFKGARVNSLPADHLHRQIPNSVAFAISVGEVTVVHAGDNRLFQPPSLEGAQRCDILIHSLYAYDDAHAREGSLTWVPEMLDEQARFLADLHPQVVLLTHLAEFCHPYHKVWRFMHAGVLKERLFSLAPEIECPILGPGECYVYRG